MHVLTKYAKYKVKRKCQINCDRTLQLSVLYMNVVLIHFPFTWMGPDETLSKIQPISEIWKWHYLRVMIQQLIGSCASSKEINHCASTSPERKLSSSSRDDKNLNTPTTGAFVYFSKSEGVWKTTNFSPKEIEMIYCDFRSVLQVQWCSGHGNQLLFLLLSAL